MTTANVNITKVLLKRGNTTQNDNYTGVNGEITVDTQLKTLRIHDGVTVGGNAITASGAIGSYSNTNTAAYLSSQSITSANIGAFQTYANANATTQTTEINSLRANITAANAAITALQSNAAVQAAVLDTLTGNAATQSQVLDTLTANAAAQSTTLTTLLSNAVAQQTSLIDLVANAAVQAQAIANVSGTYSNTNVKSYLGSFDGNILPSANVTYSLGDATHQWRDLWVSNNTIYIGNTPIRVDGGTLLVNNAPITAGSTYGNANVAEYLTTFTGNISNISFADGNLNLGGVQTPFNQAGTILNVKGIVGMTTSSGANISGFNTVSATNIRSSFYRWANGVSILDGIGSGDTANLVNGAYTVSLGATGELTLPGNGQITNNADDLRFFPNVAKLDTFVRASTDDTDHKILFVANGIIWSFNEDGTTSFPNGRLDVAQGTTFTIGTSTADTDDNEIQVNSKTIDIIASNINAYSWSELFLNNIDTLDPVAQIRVNATGGTEKVWTFDGNGRFTAPGDVYGQYFTLRGGNGAGAEIGSLGYGGNVVTVYGTEGVNIEAVGEGGPQWQFGTSGNLTLPSNSSSINYANGVSILDGISGTYGNTEVATYLNGGFNIDGPINFTASPPAYSSPGIQWPNGFQTNYFGNTEVAAYLANYDGTINFTASPATINTGEITAANVKSTNGYFYGNGVNILSGIASQSYVTAEINNLVNNAPALLDTLGEIAANLATEANAIGSILNSITSTNANVTAANVNIAALQSNAGTQQTSIDTLLSRVDQAVNTTSSPQFAGLTTTANVELTANVHIHQNLVVDGNINFIGNVTQTNITTANAVFTGDTYGFGALYAGVLGYTPLPYTVIQATADYNDYSQINFQNLNLSANASTEWVATAGNGSDLTNYIDLGIAGGAWNGTQINSVGTAAKANDGWLYVLGNTAAGTGGNLVLGTIQPGKRVNILTGGPGSANIYSYFNASGLTTNNVRADNFVFSNSTNIFDSVGSIVTTANSSMKSYVDAQIVASSGTGNITFTDTTISTSGGASQGIILNSAGSGEIAMLDYVGINNTNPGYWLHIGDGSLGAVNNTGNISVDYNNGLNSSRGSTILGYAWWDSGGNGNNNRGIGAHRQFGIYKNDDLYTTKYIEFDLNSGNANLTNIAVTRVTTTNGIFWSNGVAFASSSYGNTEVAAYLPTASTITDIQANLGAFQTFSNANAATQTTSINLINANLGAFQTYANATFGVSSYGNTQVAAYLLTFANANISTLNTTSGNVTTLRATNFSTANAVISGGYISALTNASIITGTVTTLNSTSGNITTLAATNFNTANAVVTGGYATGLANISVTGNATVGNLIGTSPNTTIIAGAYSSAFLNNGMATIGGNITVSANVTASGIAPFYAPNRPAFRVYGSGTTNNLTTTQNTTGVLNSNNWAVDYNQGSYLNGTTGVFTAPVTGLYTISVNARNSGYTSGISQILCVKNYTVSNQTLTMLEFASNSSMNHAGVSTVAQLAVGDQLVLRVTAGQINFDGNDSWSVAYIG